MIDDAEAKGLIKPGGGQWIQSVSVCNKHKSSYILECDGRHCGRQKRLTMSGLHQARWAAAVVDTAMAAAGCACDWLPL
jgi:hypothetical protein